MKMNLQDRCLKTFLQLTAQQILPHHVKVGRKDAHSLFLHSLVKE